MKRYIARDSSCCITYNYLQEFALKKKTVLGYMIHSLSCIQIGQNSIVLPWSFNLRFAHSRLLLVGIESHLIIWYFIVVLQRRNWDWNYSAFNWWHFSELSFLWIFSESWRLRPLFIDPSLYVLCLNVCN